jgi:hypothetical protein
MAEYWHIGATIVRLRRVRLRREAGEKSWDMYARLVGADIGQTQNAHSAFHRQVPMKERYVAQSWPSVMFSRGRKRTG